MTDSGVDAQLFLAEFGAIASAPNGVQKLRQMVLQLAVQGKLVNHLSQDGDVSEELIRIYRLKEAYEKRLGIRGARRTESERQQDVPYVIPSHWKWTQLGNVALYIQRGKGPKYADRGSVRVVSQKCVQWKAFDSSVARWIDDGSVKDYAEERFLQPGDLLWNSTGTGTAGRIGIFPKGIKGRSVADSHVTIVRLAVVDSRFLWCHIASPGVQARIEPTHPQALVSGTTNQVELATGSVRALPVPLPPLAEQKRIVAKVDELMALCDQLEALQNQRKNQRVVLTKVLLGRLAKGDSTDVQTCLQNLSHMVTNADQVPEIRNAILSLAVQGKLVEQATEEIRNIEVDGKAKKKSALPPIEKNEILTTVPSSWRWLRLGDIAELINGDRGANYPNRKEYVPIGIPFINTGHIEPDGTLSIQRMNYLTREKFTSLRGGKIRKGDLVYCLRGATLGKVAVIEQFEEGAIASSLVIIRLTKKISSRYAYTYLISPLGRELIWRFDNGSAQPNLAANSLKLYVVPVPPLSEQKRIVAKVNTLMLLCEKLEVKLRNSSEVQELLAQTAIAALTGIKTQENETMKAPKTELVAKLELGKKPSTKDQAPLATLLVRHNGELSPNALHQHSSLSIDEFYHQLKFEMSQGWIVQPEMPTMRVKEHH